MKRFTRFVLNTVPRPLLISISQWIRPLIAFFFRGNRYIDPIEGRGYRKFLDYGYERVRSNVLAPGTFSLERHRLCWLYLKERTDFFSAKSRVLHVAPEQAFYKRFRRMSNLDYVTTDLLSPLADVKADLCDLPFGDNEFDYVICNHVLEHIPNDRMAMKEILRVLKPGGNAILQVPYESHRPVTFQDDSITDPKERARVFGQYDHVRVYGMDYFQILADIGFEVEAVDLTNEMSETEIDRYRLPKGELVPVGKKSIP